MGAGASGGGGSRETDCTKVLPDSSEGTTRTEPTESADRKKAPASPEPIGTNAHDLTVEEMTKTLREDLATLKCEGRVFAPKVPSKDELEAGANDSGRILAVGTLVLQRASFNALWIRIGCLRQKVPPVALLYVFSNGYSNFWLQVIVGQLREARSRLYRSHFLQVNISW